MQQNSLKQHGAGEPSKELERSSNGYQNQKGMLNLNYVHTVTKRHMGVAISMYTGNRLRRTLKHAKGFLEGLCHMKDKRN